jgi:hypothetical protein
MGRGIILFGCRAMLFGLLIAAPPAANATGNKIKVSFFGPQIEGWLQYDDSETRHAPSDFWFLSTDHLDHEISYTIGGSTVNGSDGDFSHYEILTSGNNRQLFQLNATFQNGTQMVVTLPTLVQLSTTALPDCFMSATQPVFNPTPASGTSTFQLTFGGATATYAITNVSCGQATQAVGVASPQAPIHFEHPSAPSLPPAPSLPYSPVYACQPRQTCCLSRLFCRGSFRLGCR